MVCVYTKVSKPMSSNAPPTDPGATCSLLPVSAAVAFLTVNVKYPVVETVAVTFGTVLLICAANARI